MQILLDLRAQLAEALVQCRELLGQKVSHSVLPFERVNQ
jgi:hypothetical protein